MPALTETSKAHRTNQAIQVWALIEADPRLTQKEACESVGMDVQTYRRWIEEAEPVLDEFRSAMAGVKRLELQRIMVSKEMILREIVKDALSPVTAPDIRLQIFAYLTGYGDQLMEDVHAKSAGAADWLTGPKLEEGTSKFSGREVEITIKTKSPDVIDITPDP
jgi:hypothetical protein